MYKKIIPLEIHIIQGQKVVNSFEFYNTLGLRRDKYWRFILQSIFPVGKAPRDFFPTEENQTGVITKRRLRYYLTIDFAIGVCMMAKTKDALSVKEFLMENK